MHAAKFWDNPCLFFLPKGGLGANICQVCKRFLADTDSLSLSTNLDDLQTTASLVKHAHMRCSKPHMEILRIPHSLASSPVACTASCGWSSLGPANPEESHVESWCPLSPWWTTDGRQYYSLHHKIATLQNLIFNFNLNFGAPYLIKQFPLFEANTTMGAMLLSSARWR